MAKKLHEIEATYLLQANNITKHKSSELIKRISNLYKVIIINHGNWVIN